MQPEVISSSPLQVGTSWPKKDSKRSHHWGYAQVSSESQGAAGAPRAGKFPQRPSRRVPWISHVFPVIFPIIINDFPLFSTSFHSLSNSSVFVDDLPMTFDDSDDFSFFFYDCSMIFPACSILCHEHFHDISMTFPWHFHGFPRANGAQVGGGLVLRGGWQEGRGGKDARKKELLISMI